jgi:hypothetical protein
VRSVTTILQIGSFHAQKTREKTYNYENGFYNLCELFIGKRDNLMKSSRIRPSSTNEGIRERDINFEL